MRTDSPSLSSQAIAGGAHAGQGALRRRHRARRAPRLHGQVEERAGGPRGHPPVRRGLPDARLAARLAHLDRAAPLRPDLAAHRRLPDDRRDRLDRDRRRRPDRRRPRRGVLRERHGHHRPRLPRRLRGGPRRGARDADGRRRAPAAARRRGRRSPPPSRSRTVTRPRRPPATPRRASSRSSRSSASAGPPPTRRSSRRSSTATTSSRAAPRWCRTGSRSRVVRLLEDFFAELVAYDFTAEMENDLDRIADGRRGAGRLAARLLLRAHRSPGPALRRRQPRRDRRAAASTRSRSRDGITLRIGRYGPVPRGRRAGRAGRRPRDRAAARGRAGRPARQPAAGPRARRADAGEGPRARRRAAAGGPRPRAAPGDAAARSSRRTAASAPTSPR